MQQFLKLVLLAGLVIAAWISLALVHELVRERSARRAEVGQEISDSVGGNAKISAPMLAVQIMDVAADTGQPVATTQLLIAPDNYEAAVQTKVESRYRGIIGAQISNNTVVALSTFRIPPTQAPNTRRRVTSAQIVMGIENPANVDTLIGSVNSGDKQDLEWRATIPTVWQPFFANGMHADISLSDIADIPAFQIQTHLTLRSGGQLTFAPVAKNAAITQQSNWPHIAYSGKLPISHQTDSTSSSAKWKLTEFASGALHAYTIDQTNEFSQATLGARMSLQTIEPIDTYTQLQRATKYGALIVVLTLAFVILFDVTRNINMHVVQYGLVTAGLILFFLLLLSLSEHFGFAVGFAFGALSIIALNTAYLFAVFRNRLLGISFLGYFTAIYGALYVMLKSEDYALLLGSMLLLVFLALSMWFTRRLHIRMPSHPVLQS